MRAEGWLVNHKKIQRLWREEGLRVPVRRRRKKTKNRHAGSAPVAAAPNDVWAIDFCFDATTDGRAIKITNIVDELAHADGPVVRAFVSAANVQRSGHPATLGQPPVNAMTSPGITPGAATVGDHVKVARNPGDVGD